MPLKDPKKAVQQTPLARSQGALQRGGTHIFLGLVIGFWVIDAHLKRDGLSAKDLNTLILALRISQEVAETAAGTWT